MKKIRILAVLLVLLCLFGCESPKSSRTVRIVLEKGEGFTAVSYVAELNRGEDAVFTLTVNDGYELAGADRDCEIARNGSRATVTIRNAQYTERVRLRLLRCGAEVRYTDGEREISVPVSLTRLRINTALSIFTRDGATLIGWETESGERVGLGSRTEITDGTTLRAIWSHWSPESDFEFENGAILRYLGADSAVSVPAAIKGEAVRAIAAGAFENCAAESVVLPESVRAIEDNAFKNAAIREITLFDSVEAISDRSFAGCTELETLRLNAAVPPVYSGTYYATFADKYDRLLCIADERKIVLFSGSSTRFGYDSAAIDEAFSGYAVVNMGVFAYTNALPQLELIRERMRAGDILLLSPELDAAKRQFCTTNALDAAFWNMMEANYDMVSRLDLREYTLVFSTLNEYLSNRRGMEPKSYALSPADFDEDGNEVAAPSYNEYGDYVLYRPNASSDAPIYGLEVPYTAEYYLKELYLDPFNTETRRFGDMGVWVYMTYSPRNRLAVSADTTDETIRELDLYFRDNILVPVITDIFDSLVDGKYLYGTDNHLSTEGVKIRTAKVIDALSARLREEGHYE